MDKRDLDNYITGHYGEDQFRDDLPDDPHASDCAVWQNAACDCHVELPQLIEE